MLITIQCPSCGREIRNVEEDWRGQKSTCGFCGSDIIIPEQRIADSGIELDSPQEIPNDDKLPFAGEPLKVPRILKPNIDIDAPSPKSGSMAVNICAVCLVIIAVPSLWVTIDKIGGFTESRLKREREMEEYKDAAMKAVNDRHKREMDFFNAQRGIYSR